MTLNTKSNLTGMKFGKLTALRRVPDSQRKAAWECVCECGNLTAARAEHLIGDSRHRRTSCGCTSPFHRKKRFSGVPPGNAYDVLVDYSCGARVRDLVWGLSDLEAMA